MTPTCETCRYWTGGGQDYWREEYGECRRFPPSAAEFNGQSRNRNTGRQFPILRPLDWCGEHQLKETVK
jgi:hypothetical protein